jgi:hypothetical protein
MKVIADEDELVLSQNDDSFSLQYLHVPQAIWKDATIVPG